MHPVAKLQFEKIAREYSQWRNVPDADVIHNLSRNETASRGLLSVLTPSRPSSFGYFSPELLR
jgi:hypothetical protein